METPINILYEILLNSTPNVINKVCRMNKRLNDICDTESFWSKKMARDYPQITRKPDFYQTFKELFKDVYLHKIKYIPLYHENTILTYMWIKESDILRKIEHKISYAASFMLLIDYRQDRKSIITFVDCYYTVIDRFTPEYWYNHDINLSINIIPIVMANTIWNQEDRDNFCHHIENIKLKRNSIL